MGLKISTRGRVSPFLVMDVLASANALAASGADVLHLEVGQPSTAAPSPVIKAAQAALAAEKLGYTEALGIAPLRDAISGFLRLRYGVDVPPGRIAVTTGSSGAFLLAFLTAFDAGDRVALARPGYPGYRNILTALGLKPVDIPVGPADAFRMNVGHLDALRRPPDGLILASPANPTGAMIRDSDLQEILSWCRQNGVRVVSDEIYHGICFDRPAPSVSGLDPDAIVINSFSKYFSMTGWRLGWMVLPENLVRPAECVAQNLFISAPTLSQQAALAVFGCLAELDGHVARYRRNRDILVAGLADCGLGPLAPADGGFYIYSGISALGDDSAALCQEMLAETGIAATPGTDFDPVDGRDFIRFSCAGATLDMERAMERLHAWSPPRRVKFQRKP